MKKIILAAFVMAVFFLPALAAADVAINEDNFPDEGFRLFLKDVDHDEDGVLSDYEIMLTDSFYATNYGVKNYKGIEYLTYLHILDCGGEEIENLDLTKNIRLTRLRCTGEGIKLLDLTANVNLETLQCENTALTGLDLTGCAKLKELECPYNMLESINVSNLSAIQEINCSNNSCFKSFSLYIF